MANRIKGITVEIGGDTTGLDKSLKSVNTTICNVDWSLYVYWGASESQ